MQPSHVAVVILNWNGWQDTLKCLDSLTHLEWTNLQTIVVDNASQDDSVTRIRSAFPAVTLIENTANLGFGGGNNPGITRALESGADYVWLLNNDTLVSPETLRHLVTEAERDHTIGSVGSVFYDMDAPHALQVWGGSKVNLWTGLQRPLLSPLQGPPDYLTAASVLLRADTLRSAGLFDEHFFMYWEDADLGLRQRSSGWRLSVAQESRVLHKENASTTSSAQGSKRSGNPRLAYMYQHSVVLFFRRHAPVPLFPILIATLLRTTKRILRGEFRTVRALVAGTIAGMREPNSLR
jgi:GT2 family glycosyltransferase